MDNQSAYAYYDSESNFSSTAIFSNIKKVVFSKDFRAGSIYSIFGNTVIDFSQADLKGVAVLDISQTMSETKIIVPQDWRVETDFMQLFATTYDKRINLNLTINTKKVLVIKGTSVMANVKIKSGPWLGDE